jgi:hypothetical protein
MSNLAAKNASVPKPARKKRGGKTDSTTALSILSWLTEPPPAELEGDDEEPSPKAILFYCE